MTKPIEAMIEAAQTALGREGVYVGASTVGRALSAALSMPDSKDLQHTEGMEAEIGQEECAALIDTMLREAPWKDKMWARGALMIAARAIRRGRHLTASEKLDNALETALSPLKVEGPSVKIKPLEWVQKEIGLWAAQTSFVACYSVWEQDEEKWKCSLLDGHFPTIEAAQAAAQSDYENRIRSALLEHDETAERGETVDQMTGTAERGFMPKFALGDLVRKRSGSWWEGRIVGFYSTKQTPIGYNVQADPIEKGPVQLYPETALELIPASPPFQYPAIQKGE